MTILAGVEGGGTKFVCATASTGSRELLNRREIPTGANADETLEKVLEFLLQHRADVAAIGIATFGPVVLDDQSPKYGRTTSTPKPGWSNFDILGPIRRAFPHLPIGFDTDVNGAALAERRWGPARERHSFIYLTVGTGLGGSGVIGGTPIRGLLHPEMGHMRIPHDYRADPFSGVCPFHGDCWEGLASGLAIERRWGNKGELLPNDHAAWPLEARYLALGITNLICVLSPQLVILGGSVTSRSTLLPIVQAEVAKVINNYPAAPGLDDYSVNDYIVRASLGADSGVLGALEIARQALQRQQEHI